MSAPTGYIEVAVRDVVECVKAMYDYKYETLCHKFALRVQRALDEPVVTGMLWWKKSRYRTVEEAWEYAKQWDYGEERMSLDGHWLTDSQLVRIRNLYEACVGNPNGTVHISTDQWVYVTATPWRREHMSPRENNTGNSAEGVV